MDNKKLTFLGDVYLNQSNNNCAWGKGHFRIKSLGLGATSNSATNFVTSG